MKLNLQPPEKPVYDAEFLDVVDTFLTLQGEGPFAGMPAVFLRLAGCQLACKFCDTDYTTNRQLTPIGNVLHKIEEVWKGNKKPLVVITGGEPLRQDLVVLLKYLHTAGYRYQIETNGGVCPSFEVRQRLYTDSIVCSPKGPISVEMRSFIYHLKYVVNANDVDPEDGLPLHALGMKAPVEKPWKGFIGHIYLQPEDTGDPVTTLINAKACIASCIKFGYKFSPQLHKGYNLP